MESLYNSSATNGWRLRIWVVRHDLVGPIGPTIVLVKLAYFDLY